MVTSNAATGYVAKISMLRLDDALPNTIDPIPVGNAGEQEA